VEPVHEVPLTAKTVPTGLLAAVERIARGALPSQGTPRLADLHLLRDVPAGPAPRSWVDASARTLEAMLLARTLEAMLLARTRLDDLDGALELVHAHFADGRLRVSAMLDPRVRSTLFSAVGEVYAAAGWPRRAGLYADTALIYAEDPATLYRAHAVRSLGAAVNGEYASAAESMATCHALMLEQGWDPRNTDYALLLAEVLIASARLDAAALDALAEAMRSGAPDDPYWQYTARTTRAMRALVVRDYAGGMALLSTLVSGTEAHRSHRMVRGFALGVLADTLLARGEVRRALAVLEGHASLPGHALCFDMQRSAAYLALGREREALEITDPCLRMGTEHCVRTLGPLLLRRAVAYERLGNVASADGAFEEGFRLADGLGGSLAPYLTLPQADLDLLLRRLAAREPALAEATRRVAAALAQVPTRDERPPLPALSPREERLALLLRGPKSIPQIAVELNVSVNTVKSQLRSIYAKLGVAGRDEAVDAHGFFV